ncbi:MAG TPA: amidohydrolase family protein, partial [Kofleriaceae bacterium]|nr:amidohydrolase family protein [Kofleriaceae bacterium]
DLAITHVTVVPMGQPGELADQTVIVRGDRIFAVAPAAAVRVPPGVKTIDGAQRWLMPGLADMHVHLWSEATFDLFLAAGVTTVRNMFGGAQHLKWRDAIAKSELRGPTILTAGPIIDGDPPVWPGSAILTDPAAADALVAAQKAEGYDFLKPYANLSKPAYEALAVAGARHGMALEGHVPSAVGLLGVLAARQRSVEHLDGWLLALVRDGAALPSDESAVKKLRAALPLIDDGKLPGLIQKTLAAGTWNCPTLVVYDRIAALDNAEALKARVRWLAMVPPAMLAQWDPKQDFRLQKLGPEDFATLREANVRKAHLLPALVAANAPILVGTDTGNPFVIPGAALHDEIELLVQAGVPRARVLRAATADAAVFAGTPHAFGVVEAGARADLVLSASDPLRQPLALVPEGVIVRGAWLARGELEARLAAIAQANAAPPAARNRWDGVPPLAAAGKVVHEAHYDTALAGRPIGEERIAVALDHGKRVVTAQLVGELPDRVDVAYTLAPTATELRVASTFGTLALTGKLVAGKLEVTGTDFKGAPVALSAPAARGALLTGSGLGVGDAVVIAGELAGMKVGGKKTLPAVEIGYFPAISVAAASHAVERKPDVDGHRVFAVTTTVGAQTVTWEIALDAQGFVLGETVRSPMALAVTRR